MSRPPYTAEVWLQVVPGAPRRGHGDATVIGSTQTRPTVIHDGARLVVVKLTIPHELLAPIPVEVAVTAPEIEAATGSAEVTS